MTQILQISTDNKSLKISSISVISVQLWVTDGHG